MIALNGGLLWLLFEFISLFSLIVIVLISILSLARDKQQANILN